MECHLARRESLKASSSFFRAEDSLDGINRGTSNVPFLTVGQARQVKSEDPLTSYRQSHGATAGLDTLAEIMQYQVVELTISCYSIGKRLPFSSCFPISSICQAWQTKRNDETFRALTARPEVLKY